MLTLGTPPANPGGMAAIWKGALAFGLVNIPVELRPAVRSTDKISFRQLDRKHHTPIRYDRVSTVDGKVVQWDDIVKGYEITKGKFLQSADVPDRENTQILDLVSRLEESLAAVSRGAGKKTVAKRSGAKKAARKRKSA